MLVAACKVLGQFIIIENYKCMTETILEYLILLFFK